MKLNDRIEKALNDQANLEFTSSYLYLSMAMWFDSKNWKGFSHWMRVQAQEENAHATKLLEFIAGRGGTVKLAAIPAPRTEWSSVVDAFSETHKHEQEITASIHAMFAMARKESDFTTESFLKWYLDEQVEEEAQVLEILDNVRNFGDAKGALFMLDRQLAKRGAAESSVEVPR
jgi:ferritin